MESACNGRETPGGELADWHASRQIRSLVHFTENVLRDDPV